jgi:hypothetical protein
LKFVDSVLGEGLTDTTAHVVFVLNQPVDNPFVVLRWRGEIREVPARPTRRSRNRYEYEAHLTNLEQVIHYFAVFVPLGKDRYLQSEEGSFFPASPRRIDPHPPTTHERWGR